MPLHVQLKGCVPWPDLHRVGKASPTHATAKALRESHQ